MRAPGSGGSTLSAFGRRVHSQCHLNSFSGIDREKLNLLLHHFSDIYDHARLVRRDKYVNTKNVPHKEARQTCRALVVRSTNNAKGRRSIARADKWNRAKTCLLKHYFSRLVRRTGSIAADVLKFKVMKRDIDIARRALADGTSPKLRRIREVQNVLNSRRGELLLKKEARFLKFKPFQICPPPCRQDKSESRGGRALVSSKKSKHVNHGACPFRAYALKSNQLNRSQDTETISERQAMAMLEEAELTLTAFHIRTASSKKRRKAGQPRLVKLKEGPPGLQVRWMLDSGANSWLVPLHVGGRQNPCIVKVTDRVANIGTAGGAAEAVVVIIATPFGIRYGSAVDQPVPHLCPLWELALHGSFIWRGGKRPPLAKYRGKEIPVILESGNPFILTLNGEIVKPETVGRLTNDGFVERMESAIPTGGNPTGCTPEDVSNNVAIEVNEIENDDDRSISGRDECEVTDTSPDSESRVGPEVFLNSDPAPRSVRFAETVRVRLFCKHDAAVGVSENICGSFEGETASGYVCVSEGEQAPKDEAQIEVSDATRCYGHFEEFVCKILDEDVSTTRMFAAVQDGIVPHLNDFRPCRKKYLRSEVTEKQLQMAADKGVPSATWARMERHLLDGTSFEGSRKQKTGVIQELPRGDTKNCRAESSSRCLDDLEGAERCSAFEFALSGVEPFPMMSSSDSEGEDDTRSILTSTPIELDEKSPCAFCDHLHECAKQRAFLSREVDRFGGIEAFSHKRWDDGVRAMDADLAFTEVFAFALDNPHLFDHEPYDPKCPACLRAKAKVKGQAKVKDSDLKDEEKAKVPGERQFVDLCGPFPNSPQQHNYMFVGVDDATGLRFVLPLRGKTPAGVATAIATFKALMEEFREFKGLPRPLVWRLKSDLGSEFTAAETVKFVGETSGIQEHVPKARHVPTVELAIQKICRGTRALLSGAGLPAKLWPYAAMTYAHNLNVEEVDGWSDFLKHHGKLHHKVVFGELGFVKLGDDLQALSKSAEKGAPVCYLGPCPGMRKSSNIIYVAAREKGPGKYHYTTCLHDAIRFPTVEAERSMAFKRVYKDLQTISAPDEEFERLGAGNIGEEPKMDKSDKHSPLAESKHAHTENKKSEGKKAWWCRPHSTCLGCRGRSRKHTYKGSDDRPRKENRACRWSGLNDKLVKILRKEGVGFGSTVDKEELMEKVAQRISCDGESWKDAFAWFKQQVKEAKEQKAHVALFRALSEMAPDVQKEPLKHAMFMGRHLQNFSDDEKIYELPRAYAASEYEKKGSWEDVVHEMDRSLLSDKDRAIAIGDNDFSLWDDEIEHYIRCSRNAYVKWNGSFEESRSRYIGGSIEEFRDKDIGDGLRAYVTRNMTKAERTSTRGKTALSEELMKVINKGTFGVPINATDAVRKDPKATVSGLCMLASVKNAEKSTELQKMKGRIVVLGNKIYVLGTGKETFPKGKEFGLFGDVASLAAFRAVAFHSTSKGYVLESADVANAYLNAPWPENQEKHFLRVDRQIYDLLPDDWKRMVDDAGGAGKVLLPMDKCLYGHPLSGFLWIQQLHDFLISDKCGFEPVPGTKALYRKGNVLVCAYVDDLAVAGPKEEVDKLWDALSLERGGRYDLREVGECTEFLGVQVKRRVVEDGAEVDLSMEDYCKSIVKNFEELFQDALQSIAPDGDDSDGFVEGEIRRFTLDDNGVCEECGWGYDQDPLTNLDCESCRFERDVVVNGERKTVDWQPATPPPGRSAGRTHGAAGSGKAEPGTKRAPKKFGVRPRFVPMSPEQDDAIREQHLWPTVTPQRRVQKLVGQLLWVARCTRTDVSYPVSRLASGISRWKNAQLAVMSQVVGYLKRTAKTVLRFRPADPNLETRLELHTDASWHTPRSQSGCVLVAVQYPNPEDRDSPRVLGLIDWNSNRQGLTADSSAASELVSAHFGVRNCLPLALSLQKIWKLEKNLVSIRIDNKAVIDVARSGSSKGLTWLATKPFSIRAGCLHDLTELGVLTPEFIGTEGQLSDLNTKALAKLKLAAILEKLNIIDLGNVNGKRKTKTQVDTKSELQVARKLLHTK